MPGASRERPCQQERCRGCRSVTTHTYDGGSTRRGGRANKLSTNLTRSSAMSAVFASRLRHLTLNCRCTSPSGALETCAILHDPLCQRHILCAQAVLHLYAQSMSLAGHESDLFEEPGPPPTPFHGGFGLDEPRGHPQAVLVCLQHLRSLTGEVPTADAESRGGH